MTQVTIRIVEVQSLGCLVEIDGRRHEHVLVPYAGVHAGQEFVAQCVREMPLHLMGWQAVPETEKGSVS